MDKPTQILAIKTDDGYYITGERYYTRNNATAMRSLFFDGQKPELTFDQHWVKIKKEPKMVEHELPSKNVNHRFELKDSTMESDKFPLVFQRDDVTDYDDYDYTWKDEYSNLESLYKLVSDELPIRKELIDFNFEIIMEVEGIKEYKDFSYDVQKTDWEHEGLRTLTPQDLSHQHIDKMLFPEILLPTKPCMFTSEQAYKIVRQHVKQHINLEIAHITSDYNFCFTVKKLIALDNPLEVKNEILNARGRSYKNRRYRSRYVTTREVEVFEMTYSPNNYNGYTPIREFRGKDQDDLENNINTYLSELIEIINTPLVDCPHCKGMGIVETNID